MGSRPGAPRVLGEARRCHCEEAWGSPVCALRRACRDVGTRSWGWDPEEDVTGVATETQPVGPFLKPGPLP